MEFIAESVGNIQEIFLKYMCIYKIYLEIYRITCVIWNGFPKSIHKCLKGLFAVCRNQYLVTFNGTQRVSVLTVDSTKNLIWLKLADTRVAGIDTLSHAIFLFACPTDLLELAKSRD